MKWQYGLQYASYPVDVVLGRPTNEDGTVTRIIWQPERMDEKAGRAWVEQAILVGAPYNAQRHKGVRRQVGEVEDMPEE